jgi:hypothetical protein
MNHLITAMENTKLSKVSGPRQRRDLTAARTAILQMAASPDGFRSNQLQAPEWPRADVVNAMKTLQRQKLLFGKRYGNGTHFVFFDTPERLDAYIARYTVVHYETLSPVRARKARNSLPGQGNITSAFKDDAEIDLSKAQFVSAPRNFEPYTPPKPPSVRAGSEAFLSVKSVGIDASK